jgi:addiction module HigA family antidote
MEERLPNVHPGDILRDELHERQITAYRLAKELGIPESAIGQILAGKRSVTPGTALRLSRFFGTTPELWLNLQAAYDLEEAESLAPELARIRTMPETEHRRFEQWLSR